MDVFFKYIQKQIKAYIQTYIIHPYIHTHTLDIHPYIYTYIYIYIYKYKYACRYMLSFIHNACNDTYINVDLCALYKMTCIASQFNLFCCQI